MVTSEGKSRFYRPELDILRFFAFLLVLINHSVPRIPGEGFRSVIRAIAASTVQGVPLFFLLSAYLISELLFREKRISGTVHIRDFYIRRILRIWPLYFGVLLAGTLLGIMVPSQHVPWRVLIAFAFLAGNYQPGSGLSGPEFSAPNSITTLWSVSVEEQFYVLWPSIAKRAGIRTLTIISCFTYGAALAFAWWFVKIGKAPDYLRKNSLVQFQFFALGILLAIYLQGKKPQLSAVARWLLILAGLSLVAIAEGRFHLLEETGLFSTPAAYALVGIGFTLVLYAVIGASVPAWTSPLQYLGKISYGLYVYHYGVIKLVLWLYAMHFQRFRILVVWLVAFPLTILIAKLSYDYFERPFLKLKERYTLVPSRRI